MFSLSSKTLSLLLFIVLPACADSGVLRVCSDPDNLPFSNRAEEGFENRIAELAARNLGMKLEYTWLSQRKSFVEKSLDENRCDAVIGLPSALPSVLATKPYYRSMYVLVSRRDRDLQPGSLIDERLSGWRIGINVVGDDYAPPGFALSRHGLAANLVGFSLYPAAALFEAVESGAVDVAVAWGPAAGYFADHSKRPLDIAPVSPPVFMGVPFAFDISMGVRKGDEELKQKLDAALVQECAAVQRVLAEYGVPQPKEGRPQCDGSPSLHSASLR